jgi:hypothetical protein
MIVYDCWNYRMLISTIKEHEYTCPQHRLTKMNWAAEKSYRVQILTQKGPTIRRLNRLQFQHGQRAQRHILANNYFDERIEVQIIILAVDLGRRWRKHAGVSLALETTRESRWHTYRASRIDVGARSHKEKMRPLRAYRYFLTVTRQLSLAEPKTTTTTTFSGRAVKSWN